MTMNDILQYLAEWFADEVLANRMAHEFSPPAEFVSLVIDEMICIGWTVDTARADLSDMWPDCKALNDTARAT